MRGKTTYVVRRESEPLMCLETLQKLTSMNPGGVNQFELENGELFVVMRRDDFEHLLGLAGINIAATPIG